MLKTMGYIISTLSVVLLGVVSWKAAAQDPILLDCLIAGMLLSAAGMLLRWLAYRAEQQARRRNSAAVLHLVARRNTGRS
jgi:hypothetical protein